ncbi:MAG: enoyl-CoA hydratase-related protein [Deferribacterota bacterium]|nr:enoyl-CoA hydratase-related protein [Deferribacterota bacterium]
MDYKTLIVEENIDYILLKINRPDKLNAINLEVVREFRDFISTTEKKENIRAIILTGSGEKAFVAGADIKEMANFNVLEAIEFAKSGINILKMMESSSKVFIAAVNGYAFGGGFEMALACDIIIASKNAKFGFPEVSLGIIPGFGGTQNLPRVVGQYIAKELILSGKPIEADRALQLGIVSKVVEKDKLLDEALAMVKNITKNGPLSVAAAKDSIVNGLNMSKSEGFNYESLAFSRLFSTNDQKEGMKAFLEKRKANFTAK